MMDIHNWVLAAFCIVQLAFMGTGLYFKQYLIKKADIKATNENFETLTIQLKATTNVTKSIENRLNNDAWVEQQRWIIRKEFYSEAAYLLNQSYSELLKFNSIYSDCEKLNASSTDHTVNVKEMNEKMYELNESILTKGKRLHDIVNEVGVLFLDTYVLRVCNVYLGAEADRVEKLKESITNSSHFTEYLQVKDEINDMDAFRVNELDCCKIARDALVKVAKEDLKIAWDNSNER